jgi:5-methylcytosine-specific restriction endonuclease McrA
MARRGPDGKTVRGTSNTNSRGSAADRRRRKCWMLSWFGDGISCQCFSCAKVLMYSTLEPDRIIPGVLGGTYARGNLRPICGDCNKRSGNAVRALIRAKVPKRTILRLCRLGEL